jgi:hypothetical protein
VPVAATVLRCGPEVTVAVTGVADCAADGARTNHAPAPPAITNTATADQITRFRPRGNRNPTSTPHDCVGVPDIGADVVVRDCAGPARPLWIACEVRPAYGRSAVTA